MNSNHEYTNEHITIPIMSGLVIDLAEEGLARAERILTGIPGGAKKAIGSALARAAASGKTYAKTAVAEEYNISGSTFLRYTKNMNHFTTDKNGNLSVVFGFKGSSIPLITFARNPGRDGHVYVRVRRSGTGAMLDHAFFASMGSHLGIYERIAAPRLPIRELYGPATTQMMYSNENVLDQIEEKVAEAFEKRVDHEITRLLNGWGG